MLFGFWHVCVSELFVSWTYALRAILSSLFTFLLVDIYLHLRNEEYLKSFIVLEKIFFGRYGFLVSVESITVFYKKTAKVFWFFLNVAFLLPPQQMVYITFPECWISTVVIWYWSAFKPRAYSTAKFKWIPVRKKTYRNSRSYTKYSHNVFMYV